MYVYVTVPGTEPDDNAPFRRGGRRREGVRVSAQVARARTDEIPSAQARSRGRSPSGRPRRLALPEGASPHHRPSPQQNQINPLN